MVADRSAVVGYAVSRSDSDRKSGCGNDVRMPRHPHCPDTTWPDPGIREGRSISVAKYGWFRNLEKALHGAWFVAPASLYMRHDLTPAQRDDERSKSDLLSPTATISIPAAGVQNIKAIGRIKRTMEIRRAFYMSSLSYCIDGSDPRFADFGDARLLIRDPRVFGLRVCAAAQAMHPSWLPFFAPVHYYDPDRGRPEFLSTDPPEMRDSLPWRLKEVKYAWQREWRFIWLPDTGLRGDLPPIELAIGAISDVADLQRLTRGQRTVEGA